MRFLKGRPRSYLEPERGCRNCIHVVPTSRLCDEGSTYFCSYRAPSRPRCGSSSMHEMWCNPRGRLSNRSFRECMRMWKEWSGRRRVEPHGICDEFSHREEET